MDESGVTVDQAGAQRIWALGVGPLESNAVPPAAEIPAKDRGDESRDEEIDPEGSPGVRGSVVDAGSCGISSSLDAQEVEAKAIECAGKSQERESGKEKPGIVERVGGAKEPRWMQEQVGHGLGRTLGRLGCRALPV